ncbi:MAG: hypothetical protein ONB48_12745 [candidate division KSB1 bacterium]|nr:hypothetical protein [candidate division KSB1 bacterium]MDZ7275037.1 hypothetical protein [candidate division KSB1 bacterium]MDZ7286514.1 hypothetical protein [candidate division KSB1 bacterium]MDZ7299322.1 hypothetical protein [candidate division KSB1 bacterium]MDZ7306993.1 hypothetical protein [candidate division KSB1 bacterium]
MKQFTARAAFRMQQIRANRQICISCSKVLPIIFPLVFFAAATKFQLHHLLANWLQWVARGAAGAGLLLPRGDGRFARRQRKTRTPQFPL